MATGLGHCSSYTSYASCHGNGIHGYGTKYGALRCNSCVYVHLSLYPCRCSFQHRQVVGGWTAGSWIGLSSSSRAAR